MLASLQLEARYFSSVVRLMIELSKNMRKKLRTKVEKAGKVICFVCLLRLFYYPNPALLPHHLLAATQGLNLL